LLQLWPPPSHWPDISDATARQHAGFVYIDDEAEPPDYATLPSWFSALRAGLGAASLSYPTALSEVQASHKSGYCLDNTNGSDSDEAAHAHAVLRLACSSYCSA
jgi:hypothetical protein